MPLPQARSEVWSYFGFLASDEGQIIDKSRVICRLCGLSFCYSGNTTNFYSHLRAIHSDINLKRSSFTGPKNVSNSQASTSNTSTPQNSQPSNSKAGIKRPLENIDEQQNMFEDFQENHSPTSTPAHSGSTITKASSGSTAVNKAAASNDDYFIPSQNITETLLNFIVNDCRPVDVLYGRGFQKLINLLAPGYFLPSKSKMLMELRRKYDQMQKDKNILDIDKSLAS